MLQCQILIISCSYLCNNSSRMHAQAHIANLICSVRRDHLVEDTLTFIQCVPDFRDFKNPLKVKFDGEEGDDA